MEGEHGYEMERQMAHSRLPRRGAPSPETHLVQRACSLSPSRAALHSLVLFLVKGVTQSPLLARSQWESVLCVTHLHSRITCSTFVLCLPLSFTSLFGASGPSVPHLPPTPIPAFFCFGPCSRLLHHPQIPLPALGGVRFMAGHVFLRSLSDSCWK